MRLTMIALLTAVLSGVGCDGGEADELFESVPPSFHMVHLDLTLPRAERLEEVSYSVHGPGLERSGSAAVADSRELRFRFAGLPSDGAYTFSLAGTTRSGLPCVAVAGFNVAPGSLTKLALERTCSPKRASPTREGSAWVTVRVDQRDSEIRCAEVSGMSGVPLQTSVGEPIDVEGYTTSPTPVRWSSNAGQFAQPTSTSTSFLCTVPGTHALQFEAVLPGICPRSAETMEISCAPASTCGDGQRDAWEECDDGNERENDGCTPSCVREPFCLAGFPCALTGTAAFCTGRSQYRRMRSTPCAEVCGSTFCTGATCMLTGEPFECPMGQECVMESRPGSYTARCRAPLTRGPFLNATRTRHGSRERGDYPDAE